MGSIVVDLAKINPIMLFLVFAGTFIVAYLIAWLYRDEYDPKKYLKAYGIYLLPFAVLTLILRLPVILILGIYLFGAVVLVFRSQHYFDQ